MHIVFDAERHHGHYIERLCISASGATSEEVRADAVRKAKATGATLTQIVGLRNSRADWEAFTGEPAGEKDWFRDNDEALAKNPT